VAYVIIHTKRHPLFFNHQVELFAIKVSQDIKKTAFRWIGRDMRTQKQNAFLFIIRDNFIVINILISR
jgi:hypothetical protein